MESKIKRPSPEGEKSRHTCYEQVMRLPWGDISFKLINVSRRSGVIYSFLGYLRKKLPRMDIALEKIFGVAV